MTSSTWDAMQKRLDQIKRPTQTFTICEDPEIRQRLHRAKTEAQQAEARMQALASDADQDTRAVLEQAVKDAKQDLDAAQKAYDRASVTLRFTALERKDLEKLQKDNPPSEEEEAAGEDFAMDGFAPALISAASLDGMPAEYARHCLDSWSAADARDLWNAAWSIQHQQRTDLGKG